jgi:hypothetical protein
MVLGQAYVEAKQSKFSFVSSSPEDGNRTSFQSVMVLISLDVDEVKNNTFYHVKHSGSNMSHLL